MLATDRTTVLVVIVTLQTMELIYIFIIVTFKNTGKNVEIFIILQTMGLKILLHLNNTGLEIEIIVILYRPCVGITESPPDDESWYCVKCVAPSARKSGRGRGRGRGRGSGRGRGRKKLLH